MTLVPATAAGGAGLDELSVKIEPAQRRLANIETAEARRQPVSATIQTVGAIAIDESRSHIPTRKSEIPGSCGKRWCPGVNVAIDHRFAIEQD